jgi:fatty acid desaturase
MSAATPETGPQNLPAHGTSSHGKEKTTNTEKALFLAVLVALLAWGLAIFTWGVPGLYIPALAMVPVMYVILILISRG